MTPQDLLGAFEHLFSLNEIREPHQHVSALASLPSEPSEYLAAARSLLQDLTAEQYDGWFEEINAYQRFEDILRELFYRDRRSAEALIWIVQWAAETPGLHDFGTNPLAAFANVLRHPLPRDLEVEFIPLLERCLRIDSLAHNAQACLRAIRLRQATA